jgi:GATA-binding protein
MSQAHVRAQRGGPLRTPDALADDFIDSTNPNAYADNHYASHTSPSSPRNVRMPAHIDSTASGSSSAIQSLTSASTLSTLEGKLEGSPSEATARQGLLRDSFLDQWKDDSAATVDTETPEDMQKNDPLGTQIWKLYHRTKGQLPNGERLENLTWRMMSMNLRRKERERQQQGYASTCPLWQQTATNRDIHFRLPPTIPQQKRNAPSGIAQLRQSSDQTIRTNQADDVMNLDEFIVPTSIGTPAGISPTPSSTMPEIESATATAPGIPINRRQQQLQEESMDLARASAPSGGPFEQGRTHNEFGYVPRHVRKTSIDERRVSSELLTTKELQLTSCSHLSDVQKPRPKYLQSATMR